MCVNESLPLIPPRLPRHQQHEKQLRLCAKPFFYGKETLPHDIHHSKHNFAIFVRLEMSRRMPFPSPQRVRLILTVATTDSRYNRSLPAPPTETFELWDARHRRHDLKRVRMYTHVEGAPDELILGCPSSPRLSKSPSLATISVDRHACPLTVVTAKGDAEI